MNNEVLLRIIKEEIFKMYEDNDMMIRYPELKEIVLKFNRLLDEDFDTIKKINEKIPKYNISSIDKIPKDKETIDEIVNKISILKNVFSGYVYRSEQLSDEEQIDISNMFDYIKKYYFSIKKLSEVIEFMINHLELMQSEVNKKKSGSSSLKDVNRFKIFVN